MSMAKKPTFSIAGREISAAHPPYIIAELSANHMGSIDRAFQMIDAAHAAGADAVKLQTYEPDKITMKSNKPDFQIEGGLWAGRSYHDLYQEAMTPKEWHKPLFEHAHSLGLTIFSSPFDLEAVDFLETLNAPAYKIASFELVDLALVKKAASTAKPLIMSTGLASREDIEDAVTAAQEGGATQIALLHCVSAYPTPPEDANLRTIKLLADTFGVPTGLSDHTLTEAVPVAASALGAQIIEKHFTLSREDGGADAAFSLEPEEFKRMADAVRIAHAALGTAQLGTIAVEKDSLKGRRSLYFNKSLKAGHKIEEGDIVSVRPGLGLKPKHLDSLIGKPLAHAVERGQATKWDDFDN